MCEKQTVIQTIKVFNRNLKNRIFKLLISSNKGKPGQFVEERLGIKLSSDCLDCLDGEIKLFPLKQLKNGKINPKETIAITMRDLNEENIPIWEESSLKKKTNNMLFIPYIRLDNNQKYNKNGDYIQFFDCITFNHTNVEYKEFENDYEKIASHFRNNGIREKGNTINGTYIQSRTKGPGGDDKKKTVAFYFRRKQFVEDVLCKNLNIEILTNISSK